MGFDLGSASAHKRTHIHTHTHTNPYSVPLTVEAFGSTPSDRSNIPPNATMQSIASTTAPNSKRRRLLAQNLIVTREFENSNGSDLVVTVRRWGCTLNIFPNGTTEESLWQLQIRHNPTQKLNSFGFQLLANVRELLESHPNANVQDLKSLEDHERILIYNGGPGRNGENDPDKVGLEPWQPVLYQGGNDPNRSLDFIHLLMQHKLQKGQLVTLPNFMIACREGLPADLPAPWQLSTQAFLQKPFGALPPRQRRHILCQLEIKDTTPNEQTLPEADAEHNLDTLYIFSVFGGMYSYRDMLDAANISTGYVELEENATREYIRFVQIKNNDEGRTTLRSLLEDVLCRVPLYFINATGNASDPVAEWLRGQTSIVPGDVVK